MSEVPRSFRRESRLFLWVALGLILFLNFSTLFFLRESVDWGSQQTERRAAEVLRRLSLTADSKSALERAVSERDALFVAFYDTAGRRVRSASRDLEAPGSLPTARPEPGRFRVEWKTRPSLLVASLAIPDGFLAAAFDPGIGGAMRSTVRGLTILIPVAGGILVVLALIYLRSLLHPYERLLAAAGAAPQEAPAGKPPVDERDFLIARFESTIAALSRKEQELESLARAEKERADDLEIAARTLARNLPTGLLSVDREGLIIELNESGREILDLPEAMRGKPCAEALAGIPELRDAVLSVLHQQATFSRREIQWRRGSRNTWSASRRLPRRGETAASSAFSLFSPMCPRFGDWNRAWRSRAIWPISGTFRPARRTSFATPPRPSTDSPIWRCATPSGLRNI